MAIEIKDIRGEMMKIEKKLNPKVALVSDKYGKYNLAMNYQSKNPRDVSFVLPHMEELAEVNKIRKAMEL